MSVKIAVIGGTGVYDPKMLNNLTKEKVTTPYGDIEVTVGELSGKRVAFLPRHGAGHTVPPHLINYRANIWGLKMLGVKQIIATTAVGSLNLNMKGGDFVLIDQFLDFTKNRIYTFYDGGERGVIHTDVTEPYCPELRKIIYNAAKELGYTVHPSGTYVCTEGPRFETAAEIKMFAKLGGDLVGMTSVPEVVLAREAEMCYASISLVTNFAAGISPNPLTHEEVVEMMTTKSEQLKNLIAKTIENLDPDRSCWCQRAVSGQSQLGK
ncbi:methylthioadenosine phosphorylase [Carboxydothermus islandicus]|uniref:Probable 6-oxopurine nucleoside phosphorylase n=1 Tax=Carboxydothermus islandicus TaxID=661089 RepID=A0A1L8D1B4_9THEO|nr:S-methyl-5'-thioadenosine phosphorylase [Carboxydothermus islandicus]GAV24986.1 methylthioadenosine phosphorylase [Carboxydothermus islandicus]